MESLTENRPLFYSIAISMGALFTLLMGWMPEVSAQFELVEFPKDVSSDRLYQSSLCMPVTCIQIGHVGDV